MIINLSPFSPGRYDGPITIRVTGDTININSESFDFSPLPEGASLPHTAIASDYFYGEISRTSGDIVLTVRLPIGPMASEAARFPDPITVTEDGPVELPGDEVQVTENED